MTENTASIKTKPFLKWAGGKTKVAPHILPFLAGKKRLVEPFAGSCALFLQSEFEDAVLCDINGDLINLYKTLQRDGSAFVDYVERAFFGIDEHDKLILNNHEDYYRLRGRFNDLRKPALEEGAEEAIRERSALFVYLNRHAFNGICRYNSNGGFNVPYGKYKSVYFPRREMLAFAERTKKVEFRKASFVDTMREIAEEGRDDTVVYADPPYIEISLTASFTSYATEGFPKELQDELARLSALCRAAGVRVVVSNHDVVLAQDLYRRGIALTDGASIPKADQIYEFLVQRNIAASGDSRGKVGELVALYAPDDFRVEMPKTTIANTEKVYLDPELRID